MSVRQFEGSDVARPSPRAPAGHGRTRDETWSIRRTTWLTVAVMLAVVGGAYLVQQHWTPLAGNWVYLVLLACPLMHLFMHHGHGGHGGHDNPHSRDADGDGRRDRSG